MAAPLGNTNASSAKRWQAAIERAIASYPDKPEDEDCSDLIKGLNAAAFEFVSGMMTDKSITFFREFGDRLDGKPAQSLALSGEVGLRKASDLTDDELTAIALSETGSE